LCKLCSFVNAVFEGAKSDSVQSYLPVLMLLQELENQKRLQLVAGDCPVDDTRSHLEHETHYTIHHYFKCVDCGQYFLTGACIRGEPVYKSLKTLENEKLDKILWGKCGALFQ